MSEYFYKLGAPKKSDRQKQDFELWDFWDTQGRKPDDLRPLLGNFRGMIRKEVNKWTGAENIDVPEAAINAEFNKAFMRAVETYDPTKGSAVGTWVQSNLRKGRRYMAAYKNPARMVEGRFYAKGKFDSAKSILTDQLGRAPSTPEMAEYMLWPEAEVSRLEAESRGALITSKFEVDPTTIEPSYETEVMHAVKYDLNHQEREVWDYTVGDGGKPELKPKQIAQKLGMHPSKVTRIRIAIEKKIKNYYR